MLAAIEEHFPPSVTFTRPEGGLFTWLTFPAGFDAAAFLRDEALPNAKVAFVPGGPFYAAEQHGNHARLNFSGVSDAQIVDGIGRLGLALRRTLAG